MNVFKVTLQTSGEREMKGKEGKSNYILLDSQSINAESPSNHSITQETEAQRS